MTGSEMKPDLARGTRGGLRRDGQVNGIVRWRRPRFDGKSASIFGLDLALIPAAISLFAVNQWLRRRSANSIAIQPARMTS